MLAIRLDGAKGNITGSNQVVWKRHRGTPYVRSPLLYCDFLCNLQHYQGTMVRLDVKTGKDEGGPFRLRDIGDVYASPAGEAGRIYVTSRDGVNQVMSHGEPIPQVLALNRLDDTFTASAAVVGRELFSPGRSTPLLHCRSRSGFGIAQVRKIQSDKHADQRSFYAVSFRCNLRPIEWLRSSVFAITVSD